MTGGVSSSAGFIARELGGADLRRAAFSALACLLGLRRASNSS